MDSGMLEAEYESFDALQPRLPEEVVGIMDQLLSHEASHPISKLYLWMGDSFLETDGMAYGKRALADLVHLSVYRQASFVKPKNTQRVDLCKFCGSWSRYKGTAAAGKCA